MPKIYLADAFKVGGLCKSDYIINGATLDIIKGAFNPNVAPMAKDEQLHDMPFADHYNSERESIIPRTLICSPNSNGRTNANELKTYFTNLWVQKAFLQDIGMITTQDDNDPGWIEFNSGKYKLLIEPLAFMVIDSANGEYGFIGTPTEFALADLNGIITEGSHAPVYKYFRNLAHAAENLYANYPSSMLLEQPEFGVYPANPQYDYSDHFTGIDPPQPCYNPATVVNSCGLMTITIDPQGTPIYYHTYKVDVQLPDGKSLADIQNLPFAEQIALLKSGEAKSLGSTWTPTITGMLTNAEPAVKDNKYYPTLDPKLAELTAANPKSSGITDANIYEYKKCVRGKPRTRAYVT